MFVKIAAAGALVAAVAGGAVVTADPFGTETAAPTVRTSTEVQPGGQANDRFPSKEGEMPERQGELMFYNDNPSGPDAYGYVQTWGGNLNVRPGASIYGAPVDSLGNGAYVNIYCQVEGDWVEGYYGSSNIWNKIGDGRWVSDAFVYTGSNGFVAPHC